jgi:hypothetical protein
MFIFDSKNDNTDRMSAKQIISVKCGVFSVKTIVKFIVKGVFKKMFHSVILIPSYLQQQVNGNICRFYIIYNFIMLQKIELDNNTSLTLYILSAKYLNICIVEKHSELKEKKQAIIELLRADIYQCF